MHTQNTQKITSLEMVMNVEGGELMEPMEEMPLIGLSESELERLVRG